MFRSRNDCQLPVPVSDAEQMEAAWERDPDAGTEDIEYNPTYTYHEPPAEEPLPDLWFVKVEQDGEILPDGTGYAGDDEEWPDVVDINGDLICECQDIDTARMIAEDHNRLRELQAALDSRKPKSLAATTRDAWQAVGRAVDWLAEQLDADVHVIRAASLHPMTVGTDDEWLQARWQATMFMEGTDIVSWGRLTDLGDELFDNHDGKLSFIDVEIMADADGMLLVFTMAAAVDSCT